MPFIIAALAYGLLAAPVLTTVAVVGLARGRQPGRAVLAGAVGSAAGFLLGCAAAVLACVAAPEVGGLVGATALVVPAGLGGAALGAAVGVVAARQRWSRWCPPKGQRYADPSATEVGSETEHTSRPATRMTLSCVRRQHSVGRGREGR